MLLKQSLQLKRILLITWKVDLLILDSLSLFRHMKLSLLFIFSLFLSFPSSLRAQSSNEQVWLEYMLNYPFANVWNIELAGTYSTVVQQPKWRALDFQVTPEYSFSQHIDLMGALLVGNTFQSQSLSTFEVREMLGTRIHFTPNRRILTRLLLRFEQRNLQDLETKEWNRSTRSRVRAETVIPLNKPTMFAGDKLWYSIIDAEAFLVMDQDVNERFANRLRIRTGIGYRINYGTRLEFMYTLQRSKDIIDGDFSTTDNIFRFRLKHFLNKSKPSKTVSGVGN